MTRGRRDGYNSHPRPSTFHSILLSAITRSPSSLSQFSFSSLYFLPAHFTSINILHRDESRIRKLPVCHSICFFVNPRYFEISPPPHSSLVLISHPQDANRSLTGFRRSLCAAVASDGRPQYQGRAVVDRNLEADQPS